MKVISETLTLIFTVFQPFEFERTWWRLFQKHNKVSVSDNNLHLVISETLTLFFNLSKRQKGSETLTLKLFFNLSTLSVSERLFRNTNFDISVFQPFDLEPDEGYSRNTNFGRPWAYQMKVETLTLIFTIFQPFDFQRTRNIKVSVSETITLIFNNLHLVRSKRRKVISEKTLIFSKYQS